MNLTKHLVSWVHLKLSLIKSLLFWTKWFLKIWNQQQSKLDCISSTTKKLPTATDAVTVAEQITFKDLAESFWYVIDN